MYDKSRAEQVHKIASESIDSTQAKITELNKQKSDANINSSNRLLNWQSWLGNVSFSLAAIGGAVLTGQEVPPSYFTIAGLFGYLVVGLWIALSHKNLFEKDNVISGLPYIKYKILHDEKKKLAFELWEDSASPHKHIAYLKQELAIQKHSEITEKERRDLLKESRINYSNDIWVALIAISTYFILNPIARNVVSKLGIAGRDFYQISLLGLVVIILFILNSALKSREDIQKATKANLKLINDQLRHTKLYINRIKREVETIKNEFGL